MSLRNDLLEEAFSTQAAAATQTAVCVLGDNPTEDLSRSFEGLSEQEARAKALEFPLEDLENLATLSRVALANILVNGSAQNKIAAAKLVLSLAIAEKDAALEIKKALLAKPSQTVNFFSAGSSFAESLKSAMLSKDS
jgi:hypothetical protein